MLKLCKVLMFGVVLVITSAFKAPLLAADSAAAPKPNTTTKPSAKPLSYEAKVIVVDRPAKTVTVEIQNRLYLFKLGPNASIVRKGKKVSIEDLLAGQQITLRLIQTTSGDVLVAGVEIGTSTGQAEAAGTGKAPSSGTPSTAFAPAPSATYSGSPRPIVSPYN